MIVSSPAITGAATRNQGIATEESGLDTNSEVLEAADLNGDGRLDLVSGQQPQQSYFFTTTPGLELPAERSLTKVYWNTGALGAAGNHWLEVASRSICRASTRGSRSMSPRGASRVAAERAALSTPTVPPRPPQLVVALSGRASIAACTRRGSPDRHSSSVTSRPMPRT
jgi:hypothetical protein